MELNSTLIAQINSGATGASGSSPSGTTTGNGANGGDAPAVVFAVSDDTYSDPSAPLDLTPDVSGGTGGYGTPGHNGLSPAAVGMTTGDFYTLEYPSAGPGGAGGSSGAGGAAEIDMDNDQFGTAASPLGGGMTISDAVDGGGGTYAAPGGNGGSAGYDASYGNPVYETVVAGAGGVGGAGGTGGNGGAATDTIGSLTTDTDGAAVISLSAFGGTAGAGDPGGSGGNGYQAGTGGTGGAGGAGGTATVGLSNSDVSSALSIAITMNPRGGNGAAGGSGAVGGEYQNSGTIDSGNPNVMDTYAAASGGGGAGGASGGAIANLTDDTLTAPWIALDLACSLGAPGAGGAGGPAVASSSYYSSSTATQVNFYGTPAGATGATGASGADQISFTGDTIAASGTLSLALTTPAAGTPFNTVAGYGLTFSGNSFIGGGSADLDVSGSAPGFIVNDLTGMISLDGSPGNSVAGFETFVLGSGDEFIQGTGAATVVHVAPDPDTIVLSPGHAPITLFGVSDTNVMLDFEGYGSALGGVDQLTADTAADGMGNTVISVPGDGAVTLEQSTFTPATANAEFAVGTPLCFRAGTMIATPDGEVAVETLREHDTIVTASGAPANVVWAGRRRTDCTRHPRPEQVWPVRVSVDAFGAGRPHRPLFLSPNHAVFVSGVLVPIKQLINGTSITQLPMDQVTYHHIELPRHDLLIAEGLPAESCLDTSDRAHFVSDAGRMTLFPDFAALPNAVMWESMGYAQLVVSGALLDAVRREVNARAAALSQLPRARERTNHDRFAGRG